MTIISIFLLSKEIRIHCIRPAKLTIHSLLTWIGQETVGLSSPIVAHMNTFSLMLNQEVKLKTEQLSSEMRNGQLTRSNWDGGFKEFSLNTPVEIM